MDDTFHCNNKPAVLSNIRVIGYIQYFCIPVVLEKYSVVPGNLEL